MIQHFKRWAFSLALVAAAAASHAQDFPSRAVKILVPQTPGGASDALARIMAQKLSEKYTLLMSYVGTHAINGSLYKKLPFDPEKDFAPVATLATLPFVAVTKSDSPIKTIADLVAAAKKGQLTYGSAGNGSVNHLLGEMFNSAAGVKLTHVPYRGAAPARSP